MLRFLVINNGLTAANFYRPCHDAACVDVVPLLESDLVASRAHRRTMASTVVLHSPAVATQVAAASVVAALPRLYLCAARPEAEASSWLPDVDRRAIAVAQSVAADDGPASLLGQA